eukprot:TRINITY_DN3877_c0_g1_i1.p1 TRINITY_DN3877_c0_g1~~TRINITY_DN3877_c0_g1_i1.p1  ORF type:complete len:1478 (+),score=503.21 TRINITY_DN3877_c0_g1_i1:57-4490(+)
MESGDGAAPVDLEFRIPNRVEDLESVEALQAGSYVVHHAIDFTDFDPEDIVGEYSRVQAELLSVGVQSIAADGSTAFDVLFSVVRAADRLPLDAASNIESGLTDLLERICAAGEQVLAGGAEAAAASEYDFDRERHLHRNGVKMYGWLLCRLVQHSAKKQAEGAAELQSSAPRKKRARSDRVVGAEIAREKTMKGLVRALSRGSAGLWPMNDPDEMFVQTILKLLVLLMDSADTLRTTQRPCSLRDSIFETLRGVVARYALLTDTAKQQAVMAEARRQPDGEDADREEREDEPELPLDICIAPLVELVKQKDHIPKHLAMFCKSVQERETWATLFIGTLMNTLSMQAGSEQGETQASRQIGAFISELADACPQAMLANVEVLSSLLHSNSAPIRRSVMNGFAQTVSEMQKSGCDEHARARVVGLFEILFERVLDVNSWVRCCVLKNLKELHQEQRTPPQLHSRLLAVVSGRVRDRNSFVRHAAAQCASALVTYNRYGDLLRLSSFTDHHMHHFTRFVEMRNGAEMEELEGEVCQFEEAMASQNGECDRWTAEERDVLAKMSFYRTGMKFIGQLHGLVDVVGSVMMSSKAAADVVEAVRLLTVLVHFKVEAAIAMVPRICVLIFSREEAVQEAVLVAFRQIFAGAAVVHGARGDLARGLQVATQILRAFPKADEGTLAAFEAILAKTGSDFCEPLLEPVWSVVDGTCEQHGFARPPPMESRCAMRLYAMLLRASPSMAADRWDELSGWALKEKAEDSVFVTNACHALRTAALAKDFRRLPNRSAIFTNLASLLLGPCSSMEAFAPLARNVIQTIYELAETPESMVRAVIGRLRARYRDAHKALQSARGVEREPSTGRGAESNPAAAAAEAEPKEGSPVKGGEVKEEEGSLADRSGGEVKGEESSPRKEEADGGPAPRWKKEAGSPAVDTETSGEVEGADGAGPSTPKLGRAEEQVNVQRRLHLCQHVLLRLVFCLGETALRQLVLIDQEHTLALRRIHSDKGGRQQTGDAIVDELGLQSKGAMENEAEEVLRARERRILNGDSVWAAGKTTILEVCLQTDAQLHSAPALRSAAVLALCSYMLVTEDFARAHVRWLFSILRKSTEPVVRTNIIIGIGDLFGRWPNALEPWTSSFFQCLRDSDVHARGTAFLVASHLILGDMLKARAFVHMICAGLEDAAQSVQNKSKYFIAELHVKDKDRIFHMLPDCLATLSREDFGLDDEKFRRVISYLLEYINKEMHLDGLVNRLCTKFSQMGEAGEERGLSAAEQMRHARHLALAISMLDLKITSERALKRLCGDQAVKSYESFLGDDVVYRHFKDVLAKARRPIPGQKEKPEAKRMLEAWEQRIDATHEKMGTDRQVEQRARAAEAPAEPRRGRRDAPAAGKGRGRKGGKKGQGKRKRRRSSSSSCISDSDEEWDLPVAKSRRRAKPVVATRSQAAKRSRQRRSPTPDASEASASSSSAEEVVRRVRRRVADSD